MTLMQIPSSSDVHGWFSRRTFTSRPPEAADLSVRARSRGLGITVCLPALDEEQTVGAICRAVRSALMEDARLVDELIVIDSGSTDRTREVAAAAGATVHRAADILPHLGPARGKGEALWKSLAVSQGDLIVWIDADVTTFDPAWVVRLVEPLVEDEGIAFVKGFYERPAPDASGGTGGRVTELLVRPLFHLLYPELSMLAQPLAGECAGRAGVLRRLPFVTGYGVDASLLIDLVERHGLDALAQTDLGLREHRNRSTLELGRMAHEILHALLGRLESAGRIKLPDDLPPGFSQLVSTPDGLRALHAGDPPGERPPMEDVLGR